MKINYKTISLEELAAVVSEKLKEHGIDSILVGGACVTIYSHARYQSYDLDYVTFADMKKVAMALAELDFKQHNKYFSHPDCEFFVEFVSPPVSIASEPIHHFEQHRTPIGTIKMLTPSDSIKDRLASYYYWDDTQSLEQAISIYKEVSKKVEITEIKRWSKKEGYLHKFEDFLSRIKQ